MRKKLCVVLMMLIMAIGFTGCNSAADTSANNGSEISESVSDGSSSKQERPKIDIVTNTDSSENE